jgi:predicted enzyme related to lactoylglutathione lyase
MSDLDEAEPLLANGPPSLELFMTVVRVAEWSQMVRWYLDTLGLAPILLDHQNEFALLAAGQGRLGLQGIKGFRDPTARHKVRLVFQVPDVDSERGKLIEKGVAVTEPFNNAGEGYREVRLHDPDGNSLTLFAWIDRTRESRFSREGR